MCNMADGVAYSDNEIKAAVSKAVARAHRILLID